MRNFIQDFEIQIFGQSEIQVNRFLSSSPGDSSPLLPWDQVSTGTLYESILRPYCETVCPEPMIILISKGKTDTC